MFPYTLILQISYTEILPLTSQISDKLKVNEGTEIESLEKLMYFEVEKSGFFLNYILVY